MVRAGCASVICAPAPRSFTLTLSQRPGHRGTSRTYHSLTLRACQRQDRRASSTHHCDFLINATGIGNGCNYPENNIIIFSNQPKNCISALTFRGACIDPCQSLLTTRALFNRYPNIKYRPNLLTTDEKTFSNHYFFAPFQRFIFRETVHVPVATLAGAAGISHGAGVQRITNHELREPEARE